MRLGELEAAVMDRLWSWEQPASAREMQSSLNRDRDLAYTTVQTVLENLLRKKAVYRVRNGRAFIYAPTMSRAEHSADLIAQAVSGTSDRTTALVKFFGQLDETELDQLRAALNAPDTTVEGFSR